MDRGICWVSVALAATACQRRVSLMIMGRYKDSTGCYVGIDNAAPVSGRVDRLNGIGPALR
jgi:hypothetical protein